MRNILKGHKDKNPENLLARYESLELIDNPFPINPVVNKDNHDNRYNGSIYENKIREREFNQILENFIKVPQSNPNHIRLGYIQDNSYVGRGNGKSAFAIDLVNKINNEFCLDLSNDINKCFGLHILPEVSGRTKSFDSFVDLIFQAILDKGLIEYCLASLRINAIMNNELIEVDFENDFESEKELIEKMNDGNWFSDKEIKISTLTKLIYDQSGWQKIGGEFPLKADLNKYYTHNLTKVDDFKIYYSGLKKGKEKLKFIFNDLVVFFKSSGFNGGYLIVDDYERIPDFQSEKNKQEFALEIRTNFFDGAVENAKIGFLNLILVMHAGVPRLVEKAWSISGMERRSPLISGGANQKHVIKFDRLNLDHSKLLIIKYLDEYRLEKSKKRGLFPFSEDAVALISEKSELNAATILEKCHAIIEDASKIKIKLIDKNFVEEFFGKNEINIDNEPENVSEEDSDDLFKKASKKDS